MSKINVDLSKSVRKMKPMHGIGQPPIAGAPYAYGHFHYLTEVGIPYSRLHDVGGLFGGSRFVDIPNVFRNFDADENDPTSYDFTFTDSLIEALVEHGCEPYYRLGVTIENYSYTKAYHIYPPKDFEKWARICEHIIAHYIDGWADGYHYNITYWEIWNEPDLDMSISHMWLGPAEEYFRLYEITSKHLKKVFGDRIKVGGYASTNMSGEALREKYGNNERRQELVAFFHNFMKHIQKTSSPLDFFSWHSYDSTEDTVPVTYWIRDQLDKYGYKNAEIHLNEWNPFPEERGSAHHGAEVAAMVIGMQHSPMDVMNIYDGRCSGDIYSPLFGAYPSKPHHAYYVFMAFNELYKLGTEVETIYTTDGLYALCASNGNKSAILISNISSTTQELEIEGVDLSGASYHIIDQERLLSMSAAVKSIENNSVVLITF